MTGVTVVGVLIDSGNSQPDADLVAGVSPSDIDRLKAIRAHADQAMRYFLYGKKSQPDDVIAADFFDDPSEWEQLRPSLSEPLEAAKRRANKELAHLTTKRKDPGDPSKAWALSTLVPELLDALHAFAEMASTARLHDDVRAALS